MSISLPNLLKEIPNMARKSNKELALELAEKMKVRLRIQHESSDCPFAVEMSSSGSYLNTHPKTMEHTYLVEKSLTMDGDGFFHSGTEAQVWKAILNKLKNSMTPCPEDCYRCLKEN